MNTAISSFTLRSVFASLCRAALMLVLMAGGARAGEEVRRRAEAGDPRAQFEMGAWHYRREEFAEAAKWFEEAAGQGNTGAQVNIGVMYKIGQGVERNYGRAAQWFTLAAHKGDSQAQYNLAIAYRDGQGVPQSYEDAFFWLEKAAPDRPDAMADLALLYLRGRHVEADVDKAVELLERAAAAGSGLAAFNLGAIHLNGEPGVPKNYEKGIEWMTRAAAAGYQSAAEFLAKEKKSGGERKVEATPPDDKVLALRAKAEAGDVDAQFEMGRIYHQGLNGMSKDPVEAIAWYKLAAKQGSNGAMNNIGIILVHEMGDRGNPLEGEKWLLRAAADGYAFSQWVLGTYYVDGDGLEQDVGEGLKWLRRAADNGQPQAFSSLGDYYRNDVGADEAMVTAAEWYQKGAELDDALSLFYMGVFHQFGMGGVAKDGEKAFAYTMRAAEKGNSTAMYNVGVYYTEGVGTEVDLSKAKAWLRKAHEAGYADAATLLAEIDGGGAAGGVIRVAAADLVAEYEADPAAANAKYKDRLIQILGGDADISMMNDMTYVTLKVSGSGIAIRCTIPPKRAGSASFVYSEGSTAIRGLCKGYSPMMGSITVVDAETVEEE